MYNRFRKAKLAEGKTYTINESNRMLTDWLNQPHKDGRTPKRFLYPTAKQVNSMNSQAQRDGFLVNKIRAERVDYIKDGKLHYRNKYIDTETGKRSTKKEYDREQEELAEYGLNE